MDEVELPPGPAPIYNCPRCSHWLPEGTLACPDCAALVYTDHVAGLATAAQQMEQEQRWPEAKAAWGAALAWLPAETTQSAAMQKRIATIVAREDAARDKTARWTKRLGPLAPILIFLGKLKGFLFLLFKIKFLFSFLGFFGLYWHCLAGSSR